MTTKTRKQVTQERLQRWFRDCERKYGVGERAIRAMWKAQGGACYICRKPFKSVLPRLDHNHFTGEVRGLLCGGSWDPKTCNRLIGFYTVHQLRRAVEYLENPPARAVLAELRAASVPTQREGE
ncbi:MAG TPA: endonuclease domain-containing protein [Armatimonadota bacterium]|nr:endonuclease domain-containing protein [Armatimonadota bacterium]